MASCRDNRELFLQVKDIINKINKDIGTECIKFTTIDVNLLNELAANPEDTIFKNGEWIDVERHKQLNKLYTDSIIKNVFNNDFQRYKISKYHIRSVVYNSETYSTIGSSDYHRDFSNPKTDRFAPKGTWNIIAYQNLKNCDFKNAGTGLIYLQNKNVSEDRKIKLCQNVILPAFEGLVLAIKDNCFYHYTPNVNISPGQNVERSLIRNYLVDSTISKHGYELDHDELQYLCTRGRNIERLLSRDNLDPVPLIRPRSKISKEKWPLEIDGGYKDFNY